LIQCGTQPPSPCFTVVHRLPSPWITVLHSAPPSLIHRGWQRPLIQCGTQASFPLIECGTQQGASGTEPPSPWFTVVHSAPWFSVVHSKELSQTGIHGALSCPDSWALAQIDGYSCIIKGMVCLQNFISFSSDINLEKSSSPKG
jgi:hypothetical protein